MTNAVTSKPIWLKKRLVANDTLDETRKILSEDSLHTVCVASLCPNQNECFARGQATFLLLGDLCTRSCGFCSVKSGRPHPVKSDESRRILDAIIKLRLRYAVLTSVTRDDLGDGGASHIADLVREIKRSSSEIRVEVLTSDFGGDPDAARIVVEAGPDVFGHNIETVEKLYATVRTGAGYRRSLELLHHVKMIRGSQLTKSSIMVGLGECEEDVFQTMKELRAVSCDILTIGQYLRPGPGNLPVARYVTPQEFERYKDKALDLGFRCVLSGPFVRSSYLAEDVYNFIKEGESYDRS